MTFNSVLNPHIIILTVGLDSEKSRVTKLQQLLFVVLCPKHNSAPQPPGSYTPKVRDFLQVFGRCSAKGHLFFSTPTHIRGIKSSLALLRSLHME